MSRLDRHFCCSKALKTRLARQTIPGDMRKRMMEAEAHANHVEYAVHSQLVPLPKPQGEKPTAPKKRYGAEKYDGQKQTKKAA